MSHISISSQRITLFFSIIQIASAHHHVQFARLHTSAISHPLITIFCSLHAEASDCIIFSILEDSIFFVSNVLLIETTSAQRHIASSATMASKSYHNQEKSHSFSDNSIFVQTVSQHCVR